MKEKIIFIFSLLVYVLLVVMSLNLIIITKTLIDIRENTKALNCFTFNDNQQAFLECLSDE